MINTDYNLILIGGEDKTSQIKRWHYKDKKYWITYEQGQVDSYFYDDVKFYKDPLKEELEGAIIFKHEQPQTGVEKVLRFEEFTKLKYFGGSEELLFSGQVRVVQSVLIKKTASDCLAYLQALAGTVASRQDYKAGCWVNDMYSQLTYIRNDSIFAAFLEGAIQVAPSLITEVVYPFGFNLSQRQAVEQSLAVPLSLIEGPPGTCKIQTMLNIVANVVMKGERVAIVLNGNLALDRVLQELRAHQLQALVEVLDSDGRAKKIEQSEQNMSSFFWNPQEESISQIRSRMTEISIQLDEMLQFKNELSRIQEEYEIVYTEYQHFMNYYEETKRNDISVKLCKWTDSGKVLDYLILMEETSQDNSRRGGINWFDYIENYFKYGIINREFYRNTKERKKAILQRTFYELKMTELEHKTEYLKEILEGNHFFDLMEQYSKLSLKLFQNKVMWRYSGVLLHERDGFIDEPAYHCPIVLGDSRSVRRSLSNQQLYDYVIIDDASQMDLLVGGIALSCARKAVLIGDFMQIRNEVKPLVKEIADQIFDRYQLTDGYRYSKHTILASISQLFPDIPQTLLREHSRCHPQIIGFCNQRFYDNKLVVWTDPDHELNPLILYHTQQSRESQDQKNTNIRQLEKIKDEIIQTHGLDRSQESIGIVIPYPEPSTMLEELRADTKIKTDTVEQFQGQACDTIILPAANDKQSEFTDSSNRLNVAVSRAVKRLIVVTDGNDQEKDDVTRDLISYIQYHNYELPESKIHLVFDYLYKNYEEKRKEHLKERNQLSDYASEELAGNMLKEVLSASQQGNKFDLAVHIPLQMVIRDLTLLNEEELKFMREPCAGLDFLVFSKLCKVPVLAIGMGEYDNEAQDLQQRQQDQIKKQILHKYGLPYFRFKTNEVKEKLLHKLAECM